MEMIEDKRCAEERGSDSPGDLSMPIHRSSASFISFLFFDFLMTYIQNKQSYH
jgi:hypothetical protein